MRRELQHREYAPLAATIPVVVRDEEQALTGQRMGERPRDGVLSLDGRALDRAHRDPARDGGRVGPEPGAESPRNGVGALDGRVDLGDTGLATCVAEGRDEDPRDEGMVGLARRGEAGVRHQSWAIRRGPWRSSDGSRPG